MTGDTIHPVEEFGQLPWGELDPNMCTRSWSYGWGRESMSIEICRPDGTADIWKCPDSFYAMIKMNRHMGASEARREIREALNYKPRVKEALKGPELDWENWKNW